MKPFEYYKNTGEYPETVFKPVINLSKATSDEIRKHADAIDEYELKMVKFREVRDKYYETKQTLEDEFRKDLLEEFGLTNHPKADKIYAYAWEKGHSYGYENVYDVMRDIAEIFE